ncbi:MAG: DUF4926 domain-containing protein [Gammaproteobacteria bacterium]|jgi:hypothetical protein|nr:DUF4926 domain-containing protein [Gammaproteobacteria bacterium]
MKLLDVVALTEDVAEDGLSRGQVGTIVEILAPRVFEVEFADLEGKTYASLAIPEHKLMVLHHRPHEEAA